MNKSYFNTLLSLLLAAVFIVGNMVCMRLVLSYREKQLLTESGTVLLESPVLAWQDTENAEPEKEGERPVLTIEQVEEVMDIWNGSSEEVSHVRQEGQISMGDAIKAGEEWLEAMGFRGESKNVRPDVTANLCVKEDGAAKLYHSYWKIDYFEGSLNLRASFLINAVTGTVWEARVMLYDHQVLEEGYKTALYEKTELFLELAGLEPGELVSVEDRGETIQMEVNVKDSSMYARMECGMKGVVYMEDKNSGEEKKEFQVITIIFCLWK